MKRSPIPKGMQREILDFAQAAYAYMRELDHPMRDGVMLAHDMDALRQRRNELSYDTIKHLTGAQR